MTGVGLSRAHADDYHRPLVDKTAQGGFEIKEAGAYKACMGATYAVEERVALRKLL